jgi:hypothetical protein
MDRLNCLFIRHPASDGFQLTEIVGTENFNFSNLLLGQLSEAFFIFNAGAVIGGQSFLKSQQSTGAFGAGGIHFLA